MIINNDETAPLATLLGVAVAEGVAEEIIEGIAEGIVERVAEGVAEAVVLVRLALMGLLVIVIEFEACEITVEVVVMDGDGVSGKSTTLILIGNQQSCSYLDNSEGTIE